MLQLGRLSRLPIIGSHIAVMPDVHLGKGATVGSVIPTKSAICPASVGVDIGCGMAAVETSLRANDLPDSLLGIRSAIEKAVPVGMNGHEYVSGHRDTLARELSLELEPILANNPGILRNRREDAWAHQLGSLGGGNHFIEICLDERDVVWVMLHSGSRGIGNAIGTHFISEAKEYATAQGIHLEDRDLAWLDDRTPQFSAYWEALSWAQKYARVNREVMLRDVLSALHASIPTPFTVQGMAVNCHHNYVAKEIWDSESYFVTRKGAIRAGSGEMGIIPGSMGTASYIVRGKGNPESFCSCSHGAGRVMSRSAARRNFSEEDIASQLQGVECRKDPGIIDELPGAYKDIDTVMAQQADLVEIVAKLHQVVCVKG